MGGNKLNKFILLMWKNWIVMKRSPISTFVAMLLPILLSAYIILIRAFLNSDMEPKDTIFHEFQVYPPQPEIYNRFIEIAYSPSNNEDIHKAMQSLTPRLTVLVRPMKNAKELENYFTNSTPYKRRIGLQFDDPFDPKNAHVTLRFPSMNDYGTREEWYTDLIFPVIQLPGPRLWPAIKNDDSAPFYLDKNFLTIQQAVTEALIYQLHNDDVDGPLDLPTVTVQRYPYPPYKKDAFYTVVESMLGVTLILSFMYSFINSVRAITIEKEKQLKESMKIMGLPGWLHWLAWFLRTFIVLIISIVGVTIVLKVNWTKSPILANSDGFIIFIFLLLFACATITFSFLVSVFFSKANTASAFGGILWILAHIPYILMQQQYIKLSVAQKISSSLLSNTALCWISLLFVKFESIEEGVTWNNLFNTVTPDDNISVGGLLIMLIVDCLLYLGLALYIEAVFPGDFGVPQPWYFPFTRAYWCGSETEALSFDHDREMPNSEYFEQITKNLSAGIRIKNLWKTFGRQDAVKNLNLDLYEDQITVLLGHNGAGKTTTMSMLTGMFPSTNGTAIISGHDVRTDIDGVRNSMGLCLQHNVLFDNLTVWEHLYFFGKLKGLQKHEIDYEIAKYIRLLELENKTHAPISTLSGGMKRKVAVGVALCGRSKVVMLDEPTAGMDPSARRAIWDLLQQQKYGRTILLTTHYMDEADLLGDRIAIMAAGELQCCGTSFFLKKKYGAGYYLIIDKAVNCVPENITALLRKHIKTLEMQSNIGSELTYLLPENESEKFETMLGDLEQNYSKLAIQSYGISLTTLEEVFMKVGADTDNEISLKTLNGSSRNINNHQTYVIMDESSDFNSSQLLSGFPLYKNQVIATFMKKALSQLRSWVLFILQLAIPIALLILTFLTSRNNGKEVNQPALEINLDPYYEPVNLVTGSNLNPYFEAYKKNLQDLGYGTTAVDNITSYIMDYTAKYPSVVKINYIIGADFTKSNHILAWYNGDPLHGSPLSLGLVLNTIYKKKLGNDHNIQFINHPLPFDLEIQADDMSINVVGYQLAIQLGYSMTFIASFFILFVIRERISKSKHLQMVSGINPILFWAIAFLWDMFVYLIISVCVLITLAALQQDGFSSAADLGRITLILLYFGIYVIPFMYIVAFIFSVPSSGFTKVMLIGAVTGIIGLIVIQVLELNEGNAQDLAKILNWVLLIFPFFSITKGICDMSVISNNERTCKYLEENGVTPPKLCVINAQCCSDINYYTMDNPGLGKNLLISFILAGVCVLILLANEYGVIGNLIFKLFNKNNMPIIPQYEDSDVIEEKKRLQTLSLSELTSQYTLVLKDVTKYYKSFLVVNGLNLGVKPYECFGLLGVNGAGKTTTFKMMTGDERISYGDAWIRGLNVARDEKQVQKFIGYCPQFDALLDDLTARETLIMYGLIRGVPYKKCNRYGEDLAHDFNFFKHLDKKVKELSGGNKRKLSTAIALIGDPPVVFLDEPTTGMDPATKRYLWNALCKLRDNGKCIILTSHSMEECEAMCTRLVIMVNGQFQCIGSTQHLKNKFAQGYSLVIKVKKLESRDLENDCIAIEHFIQSQFPGAILKEKHRELLTYQLINTNLPWSRMFGILEMSKRQLNIEDYSLGQCSLEQVFLSFTKYQR